jgi:hypothetical protein
MKPASFLLTKLPEGADTLTFHQSPRPQVTIQSAACDFYQYSDTKDLLSHPEDPDFGYPPGHFLPFFSSALYLSYDKDLSINLDFSGPEPVVSCSR